MASLQYSNFMDSVNVLGNSDPRAKRVVVIGNKIKNVAIKFLSDNGYGHRVDGFKWEFITVDDPTLNAWCMPGGKVCFYTGLVDLADNDVQIAAVMGHEVAHADLAPRPRCERILILSVSATPACEHYDDARNDQSKHTADGEAHRGTSAVGRRRGLQLVGGQQWRRRCRRQRQRACKRFPGRALALGRVVDAEVAAEGGVGVQRWV